MQSLWSTTAQQWGCHCRGCIRTATKAIGRRATTTTSRRRKVGLGDVLVRCYSAFMATAAVTDAFYKDRRRNQLDVEIAEAKTKLAKLMESSQSSDLARLYESSDKYNDNFLDYPQETGDPLHAFATTTGATLYYKAAHIRRENLYLTPEQKEFFPNIWNFRYLQRLESLRTCRQALDSEGKNLPIEDRQPINAVQWKNMVDGTNNLVDNLLRVCYRQSEADEFAQNPGAASSKSPHELIRRLRAEGYPSYQHPKFDPTKTKKRHAQINSMNQSNMDAFAAWALESQQLYRKEHYVARICYNILVADVPVGISGYNHLMLGFIELGEFELAQAVADAFLWRSQLKPTPGTIMCLLHLARLTRGVFRFRKLAMRILGYDEKGLRIKRRKLDLIQRKKRVAEWARDSHVVAAGDWAVELPRLDWRHYSIFLETFIDFNLLRQALDVFFYCLRVGCVPEGNLVRRLLHACLLSADGSIIRHAVAGMLHNVEAMTWALYNRRFGKTCTFSIGRKIRRLLAFRTCENITNRFDKQGEALTNAPAHNTSDEFEAFARMFETSSSSKEDAALRVTAPAVISPLAHRDALSQLVVATFITYLEGQLRAVSHAIADTWQVLIEQTNYYTRKGKGHPSVVRRNRRERAAYSLKMIGEAVDRPSLYAEEVEGIHLAGSVLWVKHRLRLHERNIYLLDKRFRAIKRQIAGRALWETVTRQLIAMNEAKKALEAPTEQLAIEQEIGPRRPPLGDEAYLNGVGYRSQIGWLG
ncbi:hypothetical protein V8F33_003585 [Rhypophila sp. PSN 637]